MEMEMEMELIVAMSSNGVIGKGGKIPWRNTEDLAHFKKLTTGHVVIMGRKTYESISKPLPNRVNIVISRHNVEGDGISLVHSIEECLDLVREKYSGKRIFIIGGGEIYNQFLSRDLISTIHLSHIGGHYEGDTLFSVPNNFKETGHIINLSFRYIIFSKVKK